MSINENKYDYVPLWLPNIQLEVDAALAGKAEPVAEEDTFMKPFVTKLAMRNPDWRLIRKSHDKSTFYIYKEGEQLGKVDRGWRGCGQTYDVHSHRTEKVRQRTQSIQTKDVNKAVKTAEKYFSRRSLSETVAVLREPLRARLYQLQSTKQQEWRNTYRVLGDPIEKMVVADWQTVYKKLQMQGLKGNAKLETVPQIYDAAQKAEAMYDGLSDGSSVPVFIIDGKYVLGNDIATLHETVPAQFKIQMGLLKLVDPGTYVEGVGFKYSDTSYCVVRNITKEITE